MASKEEIKARLDDPNVTPETKKQLLFDYAAMGGSKEELAQYERQLGLEPGTALAGGYAYGFFPHDEDADLKQAQREHDLGQSWSNLNDSTPSPNSDAILDDGIVGLRIFDEFYPRYTKAGGDSGGVRPGGDVGTAALDPDSLRASVDELRGIDFTAFSADAAAMDAVGKGVDDSRNHLAQAWANNLSGWTGGAAQAAAQYKAKFDGAVATLDEGIKPIPGAITTASSTIQTQVTDYAKLLHNQWGDGKMAQMTPEQVDAALEGKEKLPGVISELEKKIDELRNRGVFDRVMDFFGDLLAGAVGFLIAGPIGAIVAITGVEFAKEINEDNIEEETQKCRQALSGCEQKLQQFVSDYSTKANSVHEYTQQACQSVQESYDALFQATTGQGKLSADPFAALGTTPDFENADHQGTGKGKGNGNGKGKTTPSNHTGGGDPHHQPESPPQTLPQQPESPPQTSGPPQQTDPSTHQDPTDPSTGTGTTKPIGQPETVEIKDGDRTISVTSPDGQGHVKVTVDDGSGKPKTYDLDFGAPTGPSGTGGPQDPVHTLPAGPGQPGTNMPVVDPATGQPVTGADTPVHAGADGRCVIQDGPLTITAEHPPGSPDTVKVTIDDGSGKPTTYTLDYSEAGNPKADKGIEGGPMRTVPVDAPMADDRAGGSVIGQGSVRQPEPVAATAAPAFFDQGEPVALAQDPAQATAAQSSASAGSDYSASGFGGSATGGPAGSFGAPDAGFDSGQHASGSGEAGLAAAADDGSGHQQGQLGAAGSGMPMGGMGAPGGGGGGDQDRATGQWRTVGDLFDDDTPDAEASLGRVTSDERGYGR